MVSFIRHTWIRKVLWASLFIVALFTVSLVNTAKPTRAENERVVTVYHDGIEQTIVTDAKTVGEALDRAHVTLNKYDSVEPGADTVLVAAGYSVNVYRARPVLVVDGTQRYTVMTAHTSAREIVQATGLTLYDEDTTTIDRIDDFVSDGSVGIKLTIHRATLMSLVLYGQIAQIRTQAKTVGELMAQKHIVLSAQDGVSLPADAPITAGMTLDVWRNGAQTVTVTQDVPFTTKQIKDTDHPVGYKQVQQAGTNGKTLVTFVVEMKNGQEVGRTQIQSVVTQDPVQQIEVVGAEAPMGNISADKQQYMAAAGIAASDWNYVDYVINRESHWNVGSRSSNGCYGLGQACPGSKLVAACPSWDSDPACQLRFFTAYASRYGGWAGAYTKWITQGWW